MPKNLLVIRMLDVASDEANWIRRRISASSKRRLEIVKIHIQGIIDNNAWKNLAPGLLRLLFRQEERL